MTRIKTTDVITFKEVKITTRTVQCPWCNTFLEGVDDTVVVMKCWYCEREFKIQQDPSKWIDPVESMHKRVIDRSMMNK